MGGEGGGGSRGGRIRRKGALEHQTRDPVTSQQGVRQREREVWTQNVWRPLLKYVIESGKHVTSNFNMLGQKIKYKVGSLIILC